MESIATQVLPPAELVLVALGERGLAAAAPFRFCPRVKIVETIENRIRGGALNDGVRACSSPWITFLDDDDTWAPHFLSEMLQEGMSKSLSMPGAIVCRSEVVYEEVVNGKVHEFGREPFNPLLTRVDSSLLFYGNRFTINAALWRRDVFSSTGGFLENLHVMEDWEFNRRASLTYQIAVLPKVLAHYHRRPATDLIPNSLLREHGKVAWNLQKYWLREARFFGMEWHYRNVGRWWARFKRLRARIKAV